MIVEFGDENLRIFIETGKATTRELRRLLGGKAISQHLAQVYSVLREAPNTEYLHKIRSLHYETLGYDRAGQSSVRIGYNSPFRLIFTEHDGGIRIILIEISKHYGDK